MNKSLVFKNKLYLFISFIFAFFILLYLIYFLINGQRGLIGYMKLKNLNYKYSYELDYFKSKNDELIDHIARLQPNTLDLDYLEEKLRKNTGYIKNNEIVIIID